MRPIRVFKEIPDAHQIFLAGFFVADAIVTGTAAWLLTCYAGHATQGALEALLAWAWAFIALIVGAGLLLGMTGGFGAVGFFGCHAAVLTVLAFARRRSILPDLAALKLAFHQIRGIFVTTGVTGLIGSGLAVVLLGLAVIASLAQATIMDALTYHLPRAAHWLQDGEIAILGSSEPRMDYVAVLPEIMIAWLLGSTSNGFRFIIIGQAIGGIMMIAATIGLGMQSGLSRRGAMLAGGLLLGMANVVIQFTAAQTDLFTAGIFAVSFYLWIAALKRGKCSILGGMGAGMALGAKGTLFYMAPSALLWVAYLGWRYRLPWPQWRLCIITGVAGIALFAGPGFARNFQAYQNVLGPAVWIKTHHQGFDTVTGQIHKVCWNLISYLAQNFDPQSQPYGLRTLSLSVEKALVRQLPENDPYTYPDFDRKETLSGLSTLKNPDSDGASFGSISILLYSLATIVALSRYKRDYSRLILVWSAGVAIFMIFYSAMQQWHPFAFRYFVLVAPWLAIVGAWGVEQLRGLCRTLGWALVIAAALSVVWRSTMSANQSGWLTVVNTQHTLGYSYMRQWREWSQQLDHAGEPFQLSLPTNLPIAAFYRQSPPRKVIYKDYANKGPGTAEQFLDGRSGWLIVPANRFLGHEGKVAASIWSPIGDNGPSLAAYRLLEAGEQPQPIVYQQRRTKTSDSIAYGLIIKERGEKPVRVALANPSRTPQHYVFVSPVTETSGFIAPGETDIIELKLQADVVARVTITFDGFDAGELENSLPTLTILH